MRLRRRHAAALLLLLPVLLALLVTRVVWGQAATGPVLRTVTVGHLPDMVAVDERSGRVFVANTADHTVSVLDARSGAALATTALGGEADIVAADAPTGRAFVLSDSANTVSMLDAVSGARLRTVAANITDLAVDERTGRVFVTGLPADFSVGTVTMLDGRSGTVQHLATVGSAHAYGVAVDAGTQRAFVTNYGDDTVSLVDTSSGRVVRAVAVGSRPVSVAVDAARGRVFVANNGDDTVTMLDARSGTVLRTIKVGLHPARAVVDERTGRVFVVHGRGGPNTGLSSTAPFAGITATGTTLLEARSGAVLQSIAAGGSPLDDGWVGYFDPVNLAVDQRRGRVFVINQPATAVMTSPTVGSVSVLDARSGRLLRTLSVGRHPIALAVDETTARLFVVNTNSGCVRRTSIWDQVPGTARHWLPFLPAPARTTCGGLGSVTVIDTARL